MMNEHKPTVASDHGTTGKVVRCLFFLSFVLLSFSYIAAQNLTLRVEAPTVLPSPPLLYIYDQGAAPRCVAPSTKQDSVFRYATMISSPAYAELRYNRSKGCLPLFLEPSVVRIKLDTGMIQRSTVQGSQPTSQYRYALETCNPDNDPALSYPCLENQVQNNLGKIWSPYILYNQLVTLPVGRQMQLYNSFTETATKVYQYRLLSERIHRLQLVNRGSMVPNFCYHDTLGTELTFQLLLQPKVYHVFCFTDTYCKHCDNVVKELDHAALRHQSDDHPVLVHVIDIDREKEGWDSPLMQQLAIAYLPQIMVVDPRGIIVRRDLCSWEVDNMLDSLFLNR